MIDLGLEVLGDLDSFIFGFGLIIFNVFGNLIIKVVIVLFSLLVNLVGSDDEFDYIVFVSGSFYISK